MGSGSSRSRKVNRQIQVPSASHGRTRTPSPPIITRTVTHSRRPYSSQPSPWLIRKNLQRDYSNTNLSQYASIWEQNGKLSSTFQQLIRSGSTKIEHEQKETRTTNLTTKHTSTHESAHVESILTSEIESIHNLSTTERLDTLIIHLKETHSNFDESVKDRIGQITTDTESILAQIVEETQKSQQELLIQAKEQQTIQDEEYRLLLEEFIAKLDEKRARQLASIQEQLQQQRLEIFNESQLKIRALSEQANSIKNQIMYEEEKKASEKMDSIATEINTITTESAIQHLGSEIKTNINLTVIEKVGSNSIGHSNSDNTTIKRTTYISSNDKTNARPTSSRLSDRQPNTIQKLVKQNPLNQKPKSQQPK